MAAPSRLVSSALYVLFASLTLSATEAFAPRTSCGLNRRRIAKYVATSPPARAASSTEERTLTDADESVLFGGSSVERKGRNRKVTGTGAILPDNVNRLNPLDHSSDPMVNKLRTMRETVTSCPAIWRELAVICPDKRALLDEHLCDEEIDLTFEDMEDKIRRSAAAFQSLGVNKGVNVAVLGENSAMWLIADHGIQLAGGASAVRGADAPSEELRYIYEHSDSASIAVLQDTKLLQRLAKDAKTKGLGSLGLRNESFGEVKTIILLHKGTTSDDEIKALGEANGVEVKVLSELLDSSPPSNYNDLPTVGKSDLSTSEYEARICLSLVGITSGLFSTTILHDSTTSTARSRLHVRDNGSAEGCHVDTRKPFASNWPPLGTNSSIR